MVLGLCDTDGLETNERLGLFGILSWFLSCELLEFALFSEFYLTFCSRQLLKSWFVRVLEVQLLA
jgi:hypothetical protein